MVVECLDIYVSSKTGNDTNNNGTSYNSPLASLQAAQRVIQNIIASSKYPAEGKTSRSSTETVTSP